MEKAVVHISDQSITVSEFLYLIAFAILCVGKALGLYEGMPVFNWIMAAALFIVILKMLFTDYTRAEWVIMTAAIAVAFFVYHNTGEKGMLVNVLMMCGLKRVSEKRIFRVGFTIWLIGFLLLMWLTESGIRPEIYYMHDKSGIGYMLCHALGYSHPNVFHVTYLVLAAYLIYLIGSGVRCKAKITVSILLLAGNIYIFLYSGSFTGFIATCFFIFLYLYFSFRRQFTWFEKGAILFFLPVCELFSIAGPVLLKGRVFEVINRLTNTRYYLSRYFLTQQPITLFGTRFVTPNYRYTMDCSYVYLFMQLGVVPFLAISIILFLTIKDAFLHNRYTRLAIILGLCAAGVTEPFLFNLSFRNLALLFAGEYLFACGSRTAGSDSDRWLLQSVKLLRGGERKIGIIWLTAERIQMMIFRFFKTIYRQQVKYFAAFGVAGCLAVTLFLIRTDSPQYIYVNSEVNENRSLKGERLSETDVKAIRESGDIVLDYKGEDDPMYAYDGSAVLLYRLDQISSVFLWSGSATVTAICAFQNRKCRSIRKMESDGK